MPPDDVYPYRGLAAVMEEDVSSRKRTSHFFTLFVVMVAAALACNYSAVTPTLTPTLTPSPASPTATLLPTTSPLTPLPPTPVETLPPTATPTSPPTISPCANNVPGRTEGCDEFTLQLDDVRRYDRLGVPQTACQGWCQLIEGDILETNNTGQAELNFSDCWPGHLFLYQASVDQALVSACTKADFCPGGNCDNPPAVCVNNGALYADKCASEFNPVTGSTRIEKTTATYMITYQKDAGDVTTIVVMDGVVRLRPVTQLDPVRLGDAVEVQGGQFLFTMPDESLRGVGGMEPRTVQSVEQLPQIVQELGLQDWVIDAARSAQEGGDLPRNWPAELSGRGMVVRTGGGSLSNREVQAWTYGSIDWNDLPVSDRQITLFLQGEPVDASEFAFSPIRSTVIMINEMVVQLVFPADDGELEETAAVIADYLGQSGVSAELIPVNTGDLTSLIRGFEANQRPYLSLTRSTE